MLITCGDCGSQFSSEAAACVRCGKPNGFMTVPQAPAVVVQSTGSTGNVVAGIGSFVIPGLGQLVQGRIGMGAVHFIAAAVLWAFMLGWLIHIASAVGAATWRPTQ